MIIECSCRSCKKNQEIKVKHKDWLRYQSGESVQKAMPYLKADDRELLISGTCGKCFDKMFGGDGE